MAPVDFCRSRPGLFFYYDRPDIICGMQVGDPANHVACRPVSAVSAGYIGLALTALVAATPRLPETRRAKGWATALAPAALGVAPTAAVNVTATPSVTSPTSCVAGFSTLSNPRLAFVAQACRSRVVAVARIGGLHGP